MHIEENTENTMYIKTETAQENETFNKIFIDCWSRKKWDIINLDSVAGLNKYIVYSNNRIPVGVFATKLFSVNERTLSEDVFSFKDVPLLSDTTKKIVELDCFSIVPKFYGIKNFSKLLNAVLNVIKNEKIDLVCGLLEPKLFRTLKKLYRDAVVEIKTEQEVVDKVDNAKWIPFIIHTEKLIEVVESFKTPKKQEVLV